MWPDEETEVFLKLIWDTEITAILNSKQQRKSQKYLIYGHCQVEGVCLTITACIICPCCLRLNATTAVVVDAIEITMPALTGLGNLLLCLIGMTMREEKTQL